MERSYHPGPAFFLRLLVNYLSYMGFGMIDSVGMAKLAF